MNRIVKRIFSTYIDASIHVALAVIGLTLVYGIEISHFPNTNTLLFIFSASIAAYNFIKYVELNGFLLFPPASLSRTTVGITTLAMIVTVITFITLSRKQQLIAVESAALCFLYIIPLFFKHNFRSIPGLKVFVVALVWARVTYWLAYGSMSGYFDYSVFFERFFFVIALMIPFEIRDLKNDDKQLYTLPQYFGIIGSKCIGMVCCGIALCLNATHDGLWQWDATAIIVYFITAIAILFAHKKSPVYYEAFVVDSIPIVWGILILFQMFI